MKLLIADDERIECVALEKMIHELFPGLEVFSAVHDGVELLNTAERWKPDIVIVDIHMPRLNGLEALEMLRMKHCEMEIVIHSAYDECTYLHQAVQLGACEFLVKPVTEEHLIQVLCHAMETVQKKKKIAAKQVGSVPPDLSFVIGNSVMMSVLLRSPDPESYRIWQSFCQTGEGAGGIVCIAAEKGEIPAGLAGDLIGLAQSRCICLHYLWQGQLYLYLFAGENQKGGYPEIEAETAGVSGYRYRIWLDGWLQHGIKDLSGRYDCLLKCGASSLKPCFGEMAIAVTEAEKAKNTARERELHHYWGESGRSGSPRAKKKPPFEEAGRDLADRLRQGKSTDAKQYLKETILPEEQETVSLRTGLALSRILRKAALCLELDQKKTRMRWSAQTLIRDVLFLYGMQPSAMEQGGFRAEGGMGIKTEILESYFSEALTQMENDRNLPSADSGTVVETALRYIRENYTRDISLEETAEEAGVTRFYLGRLLKQERGQTFMEILTDLRLECALSCLEEGTATNQDISAMSGYNTVEYFQQVFRRRLGLSPGEYRRLLECGRYAGEIVERAGISS